MNKFSFHTYLFAVFIAALIGAAPQSLADDEALAAQRALFVQTRAQLQSAKWQSGTSDNAQNIETTRTAMAALKNYPLYPYLQLQQLTLQLQQLLARGANTEETATQIDEFLIQQDGTVAGDQLRSQWLDALANNERWTQFLYYYRAATASKFQQCKFIDALYRSGQQENALLETDKIWLTTDMPDACDAAFSRWLVSTHRNEVLIWKRLQLALEKNQETLARSLVVQIGAPYKLQAEYALLLWRTPTAIADLLPQVAQQPEASSTIALALKNLARRDLNNAQALWLQTNASGQLSADDNAAVRRAIGRQYIAQNGSAALPWLLQYDADGSDSYLLEWRLRFALGSGDWNNIARWTAQLPNDLAQTPCWTYWRARALSQQDDALLKKQSAEMFSKLAKERSFYGFLAADLLKTPYLLNDEPIVADKNINDIEKYAAVMRAREFFQIGEIANARREWQSALRTLPNAEQRAAALLADRWGWYDQGIRSAMLSGGFNDVRLRFPLAFRDSMQDAAKQVDLPLQWLFAITRQESAFMPDARSAVGALGLMQLMPATAKQVARGERMQIDNNQLLQPAVNIRLGSAYLRDLAQRYNGNRVLATAAYNAGPNRISNILRTQTAPLSADVWIELLPYKETREYVQSVLAFAVIYSQRLGQPAPLLNKSEREVGTPELKLGNSAPL